MKYDFTKAPILKSLIVLSVPIIFANILHTAYQLIDTFWVGRLGAEAVAAVSMSFPVLFIVLAVGLGLSISGTILVAQYKGRGDTGRLNHIAAQTFLMMFVVSLTLSTIGYFVSEPALRFLGAAPDVLPDATGYLQILFMGMVFLFIYFVFQALMRGVGDVITPMYIMLGTVILNAILDPIFINGWGMVPAFGVQGAAITTLFTQGLASIAGLIMLFSGRYHIHLKLKDFRPDPKMMYRMFRLGLPISAEQALRAVGLSIMFFLVGRFGTEVVAAYGIGTRLLSFILIPAMGLAMASTTLVGQNLGAGNVKRAEKASWISSGVGFVSLTFFGILFFFFAEQLSSFFVPGEPAVIAESTKFLKIVSLSFGFMCVQQVMTGAIKGAGETLPSMVLMIISLSLMLPIAYILSTFTSLAQTGIWWAYPIDYVISTAITFGWFLRGSWKKKRLIEETEIQPVTAAITN